MPVRRAAGANDLFAVAPARAIAQRVQLFGGFWPNLKWPLLKEATPAHIETGGDTLFRLDVGVWRGFP